MNISMDPFTAVIAKEQLAPCGDVKLAFDTFGKPEDPPVLLIMGLATQMVHWHPEFCQQLADCGYWVIRFDNRDIGRSTILRHLPPPNPLKLAAQRYFKTEVEPAYTLNDMANDAVNLMNFLNIDAAHLVGVSMGGMIAQLIAIHHRDRVRSLTSIMSTTGNKRLMKPRLNILMSMFKPAPKSKDAHLKQSLAMWRLLHGTHFPFPEQHVSETIQLSFKRGFSAGGILRQMAAIADAKDRTSLLKTLHLPTLVVHGEDDDLLTVQNGIATADAIPDAKLNIIKGMGHTLPREVWPEIVNGVRQLNS